MPKVKGRMGQLIKSIYSNFGQGAGNYLEYTFAGDAIIIQQGCQMSVGLCKIILEGCTPSLLYIGQCFKY